MKRIPLVFNEEILTLYKEGKSLAFIAKKFSCTRFTVRRRLKIMGEYIDGIKYKHTYDRSFFEKIDSDEKARAIGLFGADGAMTKNEFRLVLHKNDEEYLTKIKNLISKDAKIFCHKGSGRAKGEFVGFGIYDKLIRKQLINLGIVRRKSPIYEKPNINKKFYKAFILGVFEGDGSVFFNKKSNTYYSCNFIGSKKLMGFIKNHLETVCGIEMIEKEKKGTKTPDYSSIYSKSNLDCLKILAYLYSSNVSFFMDRKLERFKRMLDYEQLYTEKLSIKKELLDKRNQKIIELKKSGVKNSEIAKIFGISYYHAWSISTGKANFSSLASDLKRKKTIFEFAKTQKKKLSNLFFLNSKTNTDDEPIDF